MSPVRRCCKKTVRFSGSHLKQHLKNVFCFGFLANFFKFFLTNRSIRSIEKHQQVGSPVRSERAGHRSNSGIPMLSLASPELARPWVGSSLAKLVSHRWFLMAIRALIFGCKSILSTVSNTFRMAIEILGDGTKFAKGCLVDSFGKLQAGNE